MRASLRAWYFHSTVGLKKIRELFPEFKLINADPLVLEREPGKWVVITDFGGLVFWPFEEGVARMVAERIKGTLQDQSLVEEVEDRLLVEDEKEQQQVLFNEVRLSGSTTPDQVRIIANLLAQSVALEYQELEVAGAVDRFLPYLRDLHEHGRVRISSRKILRIIGFMGRTRYEVLANLTLFDKPDATWESEKLEQLYKALFDMFDLPERQEAIDRKLQFLADNTSNLFDLLSTRKSHRLEWIVIALIAVETAVFLLYEMLR